MQVGKYNPVQRAATVLYRGTQFFAVSFAASMVGHSLTKYLVSHAYMIRPLLSTHLVTSLILLILAGTIAYAHVFNGRAYCFLLIFVDTE